MDIRPCDACEACQGEKGKGCIIKDDMRILYPKLCQADVLIIASPVYWFTFSAQIKLFMDRWYGLWNSGDDSFEGIRFRDKRIGIILTGGGRNRFDSGAVNAISIFQDTFRYLGSPPIRVIYGSASKAGEIRGNEKVLNRTYTMGQSLGAA
jgi:multimeric flavodoxin WrbA